LKRVLIIWLTGILFCGLAGAHPIHVSLSSLEIRENESILAVKLFIDDLQLAVYHNYAREIPFNEIASENHSDYVLNYLRESFTIKLNKTKNLQLEFLKFDTNEEAIWIYFTTEKIMDLSVIQVANRIFLDIYNDQTNLFIINHSDKQKGYRFDSKVTEMDIHVK
jgi:hypothetical protein